MRFYSAAVLAANFLCYFASDVMVSLVASLWVDAHFLSCVVIIKILAHLANQHFISTVTSSQVTVATF